MMLEEFHHSGNMSFDEKDSPDLVLKEVHG